MQHFQITNVLNFFESVQVISVISRGGKKKAKLFRLPEPIDPNQPIYRKTGEKAKDSAWLNRPLVLGIEGGLQLAKSLINRTD